MLVRRQAHAFKVIVGVDQGRCANVFKRKYSRHAKECIWIRKRGHHLNPSLLKHYGGQELASITGIRSTLIGRGAYPMAGSHPEGACSEASERRRLLIGRGSQQRGYRRSLSCEDRMADHQQARGTGRPSLNAEVRIGGRITVIDAAGPRLASKRGTVVSSSTYCDAVRVILDGSKSPITLHRKYLKLSTDR